MKLRHMPLAWQLALNVGLVCVLLFALLVIATTWLSARAAKSAMESNLGQEMSAIAVWVEDSLKAAQDSATKSMLIYHSLMPGPITVSGDSQPAGDLPAVPTLRAGNVVLNGNMEFLQRVRDQVGAEPAVMVMHEGKLVRVATFLTNKDGSPRFGSSLDASGAETRSVMAGQTYYGLVERNGKFYMSIFEPVMDGNKRVIGAISMRLGIDGILDRLSRNVSNVRIGETGYVFIYAPAADPADNRFIVHPTLAGKTFREINQGDLNDMAESIQGKSEAVAYYDFKDPRDGRSGEKVVVLRAAKDAGWVVGAGSWVEEFTAEAMTLRNEIMGLVAICAVLIILTMVWLTNLRLRPVGAMVDVVKRMGDGDLSYPLPEVDAGSRNEVDLLSLSLKRMQGGMSDMVRGMGLASRELESATQRLQLASAQVFEGSEEQSHSATALASAVEELSVSIGHVSGNAGEAQALTSEAADAARAGNARVGAVVADMTRIEGEIRDTAEAVNQLGARTAAIGHIIDLIKDVADQTNLLALNAAIEAARAGEQGRGFAVVADEVRKLAERTTQSTDEISQAIGSVQAESRAVSERIGRVAGRVTEGMQSATQAGDVLDEIARHSQRAVQAVSDIADSTREQSIASQEIARGVESISRMAEQNRSASQENRDGAERLRTMADEMARTVARFTV